MPDLWPWYAAAAAGALHGLHPAGGLAVSARGTVSLGLAAAMRLAMSLCAAHHVCLRFRVQAAAAAGPGTKTSA